MQGAVGNFLKTYTTPRLLQANNTRLQLCYLLQLGVIVILFALYAMVYHQAHQQRCPVRGVTTFQSFGGFYMPEETEDLNQKYPTIFQKFWSASDIVERSEDGFMVLSNIVITPNQTQKTCPESPNVPKSICTDDPEEKLNRNFSYTECQKGSQSVSGVQTGLCVYNSLDTLKLFQNSSDGAVLEGAKNLIILLKTAADFPLCGDTYFGMHETLEGKPNCMYHPVNNPSCPWFTIHDLVLYGGFISFTNIASTGQIFRITVNWQCDFDWKESCVPKYSIAPVFGRHQEWESFYKEEPFYQSQGTRTQVRKFGLKFIIEHQGEGRKTTMWLLMKTLSLGFPYLFIPGFVITLLYNKFFKNMKKFKRKKYYQYSEQADEEPLILNVDPSLLEIRHKIV
ncbi:P2X purinoceptor 6 [Folsomia candida]|uniref:P2X purinoceptor 6 n=1 Tax=Folsomia candida TaxID=158441 RepID=A0A226EQH4_FOLCA|nr:P2X purinoceptor 6 [Folsomia candida]